MSPNGLPGMATVTLSPSAPKRCRPERLPPEERVGRRAQRRRGLLVGSKGTSDVKSAHRTTPLCEVRQPAGRTQRHRTQNRGSSRGAQTGRGVPGGLSGATKAPRVLTGQGSHGVHVHRARVQVRRSMAPRVSSLCGKKLQDHVTGMTEVTRNQSVPPASLSGWPSRGSGQQALRTTVHSVDGDRHWRSLGDGHPSVSAAFLQTLPRRPPTQ